MARDMQRPEVSPQMKNYRLWKYNEISSNHSQFFNFFLENNDIFRVITEEDEQILVHSYWDYRNNVSNYSTFFGVLFTDQIVFRFAFPNFRIKGLRATLFLTKYVALPLIGFRVGQYFHRDDLDEAYKQMAEKYSFNYQDYNRAFDIFDRAERVGRLDELMEKRDQFDWTGVPEYSSMQSKQE